MASASAIREQERRFATVPTMPVKIGEVETLFRYPVKSMSGERLETAELGWHGLDGDRRLAFRRADDRSGFPWLTASKLTDLVLFAPLRRGPAARGLPTHVRTPDGEELGLFSEQLAADVGRRHGSPVQMTHLNRGIFDEASVSLITSATVSEVGELAAQPPDVRRFRANIVMSSLRSVPFEEEDWVGGVLSFGEGSEAAAIGVTNRDERCSMVNIDPDTARLAAEVLKAIVRVRDNKAGVYGTVLRRGCLAVGQPILFEPAARQPAPVSSGPQARHS
jgi:uncharacterized protein YcbX